MPDEVIRQIVKWDVDTASVQRVRAHAQQIENELKSLSRSAGQIDRAFTGTQADRYFAEVNQGLDDLRRQALTADTAVKTLDTTLKTTDRGAQLYGNVESRLRAIGGGLGAIGGSGVQQAIGTGAEFFGAVGGARLLRKELPELTRQMGVTKESVALLTVGVVAAGAAFLVARDDVQEWSAMASAAHQQTSGAIAALKNYYEFIGTATKEELVDRQVGIVKEREMQGNLLADLLALQRALESGIDTGDRANVIELVGEGAIRALDAFGMMEVGLKDVNTAISETQTNLVRLDAEFNLYTQARLDNVTATADAAKAEKELTAEREKAAKFKSEARGSAATEGTYQQFFGLSSVRKGTDITAIVAAERKAEEQRISILANFALESSQTEAKRALSSAREQEDFDLKRTRDLAAHYADMAQLDADYYSDRQSLLDQMKETADEADQQLLDELSSYNREAQRAAEDHHDRMAQIQQEADSQMLRASARLDATSAFWARKDKEKSLKEQDDQYKKEQRRRDQDYQDRVKQLDRQRQKQLEADRKSLADLDRQHVAEENRRNQAFWQQLAQEDQQRALKNARQQQDWQNEDFARQQHIAMQAGIVKNGFDILNGTAQYGMDAFNLTVAQKLANLIISVGGYLPQSLVQQTVGGALGAKMPGYARGGVPAVGRDVRMNDNETVRFLTPARIYPAKSSVHNTRSIGKVNITVNGGAGSPADIAQAVRQEIVTIFEGV